MTSLKLLSTIQQLDLQLQHHCGGTIATLNSEKNSVTSYEELFEFIDLTQIENLESVLDSLFMMQQQECNHFPNNIFWDKDYFVSYFIAEIGKQVKKVQQEYIDIYLARYLSLLELFGNKSTIRFQYLHDFTYGFDWAKWVLKDSDKRCDILPFSMVFLDRMYGRGKELEQKIRENDSKYPQLQKNSYRNPFQFQRSIESETILMKQLATIEGIPIKCWYHNGDADWNKPYNDLRNIEAERLGLT